MTASDFLTYLKTSFPLLKFYNNSIDKAEKQCIGLYTRGSAPVNVALGGPPFTSYMWMPFSLLVHWSENASLCETQAQALYNFLKWKYNFFIGGHRVISVTMKEPSPVFVGRDDGNIVEMLFNFNVTYDF